MSNYAAAANFKNNWNNVEGNWNICWPHDVPLSDVSLSRKELKCRMEAVQPGTTKRAENGGYKTAFHFYLWAHFQILNYFSAQTSTSAFWRMELSS